MVGFAAMPSEKDHLSERDICTKFILPALERAGWDRQSQFFELAAVLTESALA